VAADDEHHLIDTGGLVQGFETVGDSSGGAMETAAGVGVEDLSLLHCCLIGLDLVRGKEQVAFAFEYAQHRHRRHCRLPFGLTRVVADRRRHADEGVRLGEHVGGLEALTVETQGRINVSVAELQRERIRPAKLPGQRSLCCTSTAGADSQRCAQICALSSLRTPLETSPRQRPCMLSIVR
jgi:hypothetical protein